MGIARARYMGEGQAYVDTNLTLGLSLSTPTGAGESGKKRKEPEASEAKVPSPFPMLHLSQEDENEPDFSYDRDDYVVDDDDGTNQGGGAASSSAAKKKLRLSIEQSAILEGTFSRHPTLNPTQKQELAARLDLQPRQVEVWFQNRRARTKLKQTENCLATLRQFTANLVAETNLLKVKITELQKENYGLKSAIVSCTNSRPTANYLAAGPQQNVPAASSASRMTAVEVPNRSCSGNEGGGTVNFGGTLPVRPVEFNNCCPVAWKRGRY